MMGKYFSRSRTATRVSAVIPAGPAAVLTSGAMAESPFADNRGGGLRRGAQFAEVDVLVVFVQHAPREMAVAEIDDRRWSGRAIGPRIAASRRKCAARRQTQKIRRLAVDGDESRALLLVQPGQRLEKSPRIRMLGILEDLLGGAVLHH